MTLIPKAYKYLSNSKFLILPVITFTIELYPLGLTKTLRTGTIQLK